MLRYTWLFVALAATTTTTTTTITLVESAGLGEQLLWASDTGHLRSDDANKDALFVDAEGLSATGEQLAKEYEQVMRKVKIELVAPAKDLSNVMNTIVTKAKAKFLQEYELYYKTMKVDSSSRPMLYSYLCLTLLDQSLIDSWYQPLQRRAGAKVINSCKSLAQVYGAGVAKLQKSDLDLVERAKSEFHNKNQLAYFMFQSNLNLFMINNYLLLCSRLNPQVFGQEGSLWLL